MAGVVVRSTHAKEKASPGTSARSLVSESALTGNEGDRVDDNVSGADLLIFFSSGKFATSTLVSISIWSETKLGFETWSEVTSVRAHLQALVSRKVLQNPLNFVRQNDSFCREVSS